MTRLPKDENLCGCDIDFRHVLHTPDESLPLARGNVEGDEKNSERDLARMKEDFSRRGRSLRPSKRGYR